jgi:hypothetical protein
MPQTLFERFCATVLLVSTAVLIGLVVRETRSDEPPAAARAAGVLEATSPAATQAPPPKEEAALPAPAVKPKPVRPATRLLLVASGGDSWLEVRRGSAQGKVVYTGTLLQGGKVDAKAKRLWVRIGAATNLTARLNGKPLSLGPGTYDALVSPAGLELVTPG